MKKQLYLFLLSLFLFNGCVITDVKYDTIKDKKIKPYVQYVENKQCVYLIGPYYIMKPLTKEQFIQETIKKANEDGLFGNKLVNIKLKEGGYVTPIVSKLCLYLEANLVYDKFLDL